MLFAGKKHRGQLKISQNGAAEGPPVTGFKQRAGSFIGDGVAYKEWEDDLVASRSRLYCRVLANSFFEYAMRQSELAHWSVQHTVSRDELGGVNVAN